MDPEGRQKDLLHKPLKPVPHPRSARETRCHNLHPLQEVQRRHRPKALQTPVLSGRDGYDMEREDSPQGTEALGSSALYRLEDLLALPNNSMEPTPPAQRLGV